MAAMVCVITGAHQPVMDGRPRVWSLVTAAQALRPCLVQRSLAMLMAKGPRRRGRLVLWAE